MGRFELLAPAGSPEALRAAVNAGADAVYIGGSAFGARAYADNADTDSLIDCIRFCHLRGKKLYLTVNTLFKEDELENRLFSFLHPFYEAGLDAVIVQDTGAVDYIAAHFPGLPIHLSTQTAITMAEGTFSLAEKYPCITRVVPARELSLAEIERFRKDSSLEMEIFIHGALCCCYSGQCLMSSMIGGRSGNRGRCAQPCRKLYDSRYLLSPKDQCLLPVLHELMDIGIDSFKIEGRMKSPEYTAGVVSVYRRYIDKYEKLGSAGYSAWLNSNKSMLDADMMLLQDLYNRGGFNAGYLHAHNGPDMMTFDRPNHSGTLVGEVITVRGREAVIRFSAAVFAQDVLEIRAENKKVFEFTLGQGFNACQTFSCITMKDRKAAVGMAVYRTRPNSLLEKLRAEYIDRNVKVPVRMKFTGHLGEACALEISTMGGGDASVPELSAAGGEISHGHAHSGTCRKTSVRITGAVVEAALKAPSDAASVIKQLSKLGETDFCVDGEIEVELDNNVFIPSGELNRMRREAAEALRNEMIRRFERTAGEASLSTDQEESGEIAVRKTDSGSTPAKIFSVWNERQFDAVVDIHKDDPGTVDIYFNISSFDKAVVESLARKIASLANTSLWLDLPYISRSAVYDRMKKYIVSIAEQYPEIGYIARTREEVYLLKSIGARYRTDYNLYVMNGRTAALAETEYTLPQELSYNELKTVAGDRAELIIYGSQPVMFSAQCVYKNKTGRCRLGDTDMLSAGTTLADFVAITDELGHDFRCRQMCDFCYNIIYNSAVLDLRDCADETDELNLRAVRYDFTFEQPDDIKAIIAGLPLPSREPVTHGHFHRGIM